jgi:hypothetical protein
VTRLAIALATAIGAGGGGIKEPGPQPPRGRLTIGEIAVTGALASADAARVVRGRGEIFRACYQRELDRDKTLAGLLSVRISIGADGTVVGSRVDGTDALGGARSCIRSQIGRLVFPATSGLSTVTAKMVLAPNG